MTGALADELRLLPHVVRCEWRRATAFRTGFVLREILRGIGRPAVMGVVFYAMLRGSDATSFRGYAFPDLVHYLIWTAAIQKCLTEERSLDLADQIFDGFITKYLVMPVSFMTLAWGRFLQFTGIQLLFALAFWCGGAILVPAWWAFPVSGLALAQAFVLVMLGACCYLLVHFILNCLAFWLDVVWSLLNMFRFIALFASGVLVPVTLMPDRLQAVLHCLFPYWTVCAPVELLLGRLGTQDFLRGLGILGAWAVALQVLAMVAWKRGLTRHSGVGA